MKIIPPLLDYKKIIFKPVFMNKFCRQFGRNHG